MYSKRLKWCKKLYGDNIEKVGKIYLTNIGPYTDFEWGMLMGQYHALSWVGGGGEWDEGGLTDT